MQSRIVDLKSHVDHTYEFILHFCLLYIFKIFHNLKILKQYDIKQITAPPKK